MQFHELMPGSVFKFGDLPTAISKEFGMKKDCGCEWIKLNEQGDVMLLTMPYLVIDRPRPSGSNRDERTKGSGFFAETDLFQWLIGNVTKRHFDIGIKNTFRSIFTKPQLELFDYVERTYTVPKGKIRAHGKQKQIISRFSMASVEELKTFFEMTRGSAEQYYYHVLTSRDPSTSPSTYRAVRCNGELMNSGEYPRYRNRIPIVARIAQEAEIKRVNDRFVIVTRDADLTAAYAKLMRF